MTQEQRNILWKAQYQAFRYGEIRPATLTEDERCDAASEKYIADCTAAYDEEFGR